MIDKLNQDEVDIKKQDEETRKELQTEHVEFKKVMAQKIFELKDQLDTILSNPSTLP